MPSRALLALISSLTVSSVLVPAMARGGFETTAYKVLRLEEVKGSALEKAGCQLCHVNARGGAPWNAFGLAFGKFRAKKLPVDQALYERLKLLDDADTDGYADALEVMAGTLPGDAKSVPTETLEVLQKKLEAAGGMERFRPAAR